MSMPFIPLKAPRVPCQEDGGIGLEALAAIALKQREQWAKLPEDSGGSCNYYKVEVGNPTTPYEPAYTAECNDVIEALNMTYAEANMFKEIWRTAAARTLGKEKAGHSVVRGAEKIQFFAKRHAIQHGVKP
tara:strand:- start:276 stop:668 length:393 start_codon:yes stop_codon:yes gene_type:complete